MEQLNLLILNSNRKTYLLEYMLDGSSFNEQLLLNSYKWKSEYYLVERYAEYRYGTA